MSRHIYDLAESLKLKYKTEDPFDLAEALGIFVSFKPLGHLKGFYCLMNRERHIVINEALGREERRVVCAHELGHDRLHQNFARFVVLRDLMLYDMSSKPEYEANVFAANLLICDSDITALEQDYDFREMGSILRIDPNLVTFKLLSMTSRGYRYNISQKIDSAFLGKRDERHAYDPPL